MSLRAIDYIFFFSDVWMAGMSIYCYRRLDKVMRIFALFLVTCFFADQVLFYTAKHHLHNLWLFWPIQYVEGIVCLYAISAWNTNQKLRSLIRFFSVIYIATGIYAIGFGHPFEVVQNIDRTAKAIFVSILSGALLIILSQNEDIILVNDHRFWMLAGMMTNMTTTILIFATYSVPFGSNDLLGNYTENLFLSSNVITNIIYSYGIRCSYLKNN